jgi:hypothetical protein
MNTQSIPAPLYDFAVAVREFALLCIAEENSNAETEAEQVAS